MSFDMGNGGRGGGGFKNKSTRSPSSSCPSQKKTARQLDSKTAIQQKTAKTSQTWEQQSNYYGGP